MVSICQLSVPVRDIQSCHILSALWADAFCSCLANTHIHTHCPRWWPACNHTKWGNNVAERKKADKSCIKKNRGPEEGWRDGRSRQIVQRDDESDPGCRTLWMRDWVGEPSKCCGQGVRRGAAGIRAAWGGLTQRKAQRWLFQWPQDERGRVDIWQIYSLSLFGTHWSSVSPSVCRLMFLIEFLRLAWLCR